MKSKKITIIISLALLLIAVVLIVLSFFVCNNRTSGILNGLGFGVLGSAIVTFAVSIGEYSNEKRVSLEDYYSEAYSILSSFRKIVYCECNEEKDLLIAFNSECKANKVWEELNLSEFKRKTEARDALLNYYQKANLITKNYTEQQENAIISVRNEKMLDSIEKSIDSYMKASTISLKGLENAYGKINYFTPFGNSKNRNWIYRNIHSKIRDSLNAVIIACFYFEMYRNGELKNNLFAAYDQLKIVTNVFFSEATFDKKDDGYELYKVTATVVSDIDKNLEELRHKIYKIEPEAVEPTVVMMRQINLGVDENV